MNLNDDNPYDDIEEPESGILIANFNDDFTYDLPRIDEYCTNHGLLCSELSTEQLKHFEIKKEMLPWKK